MPLDPQTILPRVIHAVLEAGAQVAAEFGRPDGPRFSDNVTAPLDHEIEMMLRDRLLALVPARFVGEEAGILDAPANGYCWVVDPHDGTRAFLEGKRGSAVSVALLHRGTPILAAVYAPTSPDRGPDLIAWAAGGPIQRDGKPVDIDLSGRELAAGDVVFLNHGVWQRPVWHGQASAPASFMPLPSIAYRLARIAVGDGIATLTLRPVNALDIAAGHALLMAAGGVLVAEDGAPVTYDEQGHSRPSACFGGAPKAVDALRARSWRGSQEPRREPRIALTWPRLVPEALLDRAAGCLLGLAIGGDLGPEAELAVATARALVGCRNYDQDRVAAAIRDWGGPAASPVRAIPIALWARDPDMAEAAARLDQPDDPLAPVLARWLARRLAAADIDGDAYSGAAGDIPNSTDINLHRVAHAKSADVAAAEAWPGAKPLPPAIAAAMKGLALGRTAFPVPQVMRVLTWRPDAGLGAAVPRPDICWTDDLIDLAEALLTTGPRIF